MAQKRILLVDDYPDALEIWGLYLRSMGYDVVEADDGLKAVAQAYLCKPDIIVLDLELPGISGCEAAVRLRRRDGAPPGFSMPLYPLPLVVYGVGILGVCVFSAIGDPAGALFGLMVPLTGAVVYRLKFR